MTGSLPGRAVQRILVVKLCCLGDLIFLTPTLRALRLAHPAANITLLVSRWVQPLIGCIPYVDDCILFDAPFSASRIEQARSTWRLVAQLRRRRFDLVLLGHRDRFFRWLARASGAPVRVGFGPAALLTHSAPFDAAAHEVDRYLALIHALGWRDAGTQLELRPQAVDIASADALLRSHGIALGERVVAVLPGGGDNPGTSMTIKRWQPAGFAKLIRRVLARDGGRVLLLGAPSEKSLGDAVLAEVNDARVINLAGATTLAQLVALLQRCALVVTNDTGPLQMAAAVGTPTVSIFGPSDPRLVAPRGPNHRTLWHRVECAPCYTPATTLDRRNYAGRTFPCHTGTHVCMRGLPADKVWRAVAELLPAGAASTG